jgi:hypothetical protein
MILEVCLLPKMPGPCQSSSIRYYYDREKNECQQFRYGGCNGNANNYDTIEKCQSNCVKQTVGQDIFWQKRRKKIFFFLLLQINVLNRLKSVHVKENFIDFITIQSPVNVDRFCMEVVRRIRIILVH